MSGTSVGEINKHRILRILSQNYPSGQGRSSLELTRELGLHRDTVSTHLADLMVEGYVIKTEGRRGKYHITQKVFQYPGLGSSLFGQRAISHIKDWKPISTHNQFFNKKQIEKFLNHFKTKENQLENDSEYYEFILFEFASRIGAYITFVLIQALNPARSTKDLPLKGRQKETLVTHWINGAMDPISILEEFIRIPLISQGLKNPLDIQFNKKNRKRKYSMDNDSWSPYDLQVPQIFTNLISAFQKNYPNLYDELDKIRTESIKDVDYHEKGSRDKKARI